MVKSNILSDLVSKLSDSLPSQIGAIKKDFEKSCRMILDQAFDKFDLVRREEFDVQSKVLARTRKKCESLEAELKKLEALIAAKKKRAK